MIMFFSLFDMTPRRSHNLKGVPRLHSWRIWQDFMSTTVVDNMSTVSVDINCSSYLAI